MQLLMMGTRPDNKLERLDVNDVIEYAFQFLSIEDVYVCRLVCRSWNDLALDGSTANSDRYCFIGPNASICYDMLLKQKIYENTQLTSHKILVEPYNTQLFDLTKEDSHLNKSIAYRNMYRGTPLIFTYTYGTAGMNAVTEDFFLTAIDTSSGKNIIWTKSKSSYKPYSVTLKQQTLMSYQLTPIVPEQVLNIDDMLRDEEEQEEETKPIIDYTKDELLQVFFSKHSKLVYVQYDSFLVALDPYTGNCVATYDLESVDEEEEQERTSQRKSVLHRTLMESCMYDVPNFVLVPIQKKIIVLNSRTLMPVRTIRTGHHIRKIIRRYTDEDENDFFNVQSSENTFHLISQRGREMIETETPVQLGRENLHFGGSVYSINESKIIFHTRQLGASQENYFLMYESQDNMLEGFYAFEANVQVKIDKKRQKTEKKDTERPILKIETLKVKLSSIYREYKEKYVNRQKEVYLVCSPALVWEIDLPIPYKACENHSYCVYGERLYLLVQYKQEIKEDAETDEDEEEIMVDVDTKVRCCVYCIDIAVGRVIWKNVYKVDDFERTNMCVKGLLLIVKSIRSEAETVHVFSQLSGHLYESFNFDSASSDLEITFT